MADVMLVGWRPPHDLAGARLLRSLGDPALANADGNHLVRLYPGAMAELTRLAELVEAAETAAAKGPDLSPRLRELLAWLRLRAAKSRESADHGREMMRHDWVREGNDAARLLDLTAGTLELTRRLVDVLQESREHHAWCATCGDSCRDCELCRELDERITALGGTGYDRS